MIRTLSGVHTSDARKKYGERVGNLKKRYNVNIVKNMLASNVSSRGMREDAMTYSIVASSTTYSKLVYGHAQLVE